MSFAIKKVDDDILFAESIFDPVFQDDLTKYNPEISNIQIISNKGYVVLYDHFTIGEESLLKILIDKLLNKIDILSVDSISKVVIKPLTDFLARINKLFFINNTETMYGAICIMGDENVYMILSNFSIVKQDRLLDWQNSVLLSLNEVLGDPSPLDLIRVKAKADIFESETPLYMIHYGSLNSNKISVENQKGESIQFDKENFICHW